MLAVTSPIPIALPSVMYPEERVGQNVRGRRIQQTLDARYQHIAGIEGFVVLSAGSEDVLALLRLKLIDERGERVSRWLSETAFPRVLATVSFAVNALLTPMLSMHPRPVRSDTTSIML
jgi:hypothetical protein